MGLSTKDSSLTVKPLAKGNSTISMAMSTMGSGQIIKQMGTECIRIPKGRDTKDNGKTINSTAKGWKCGMKVRNMTANMQWGRRKALGSTSGRTGLFTRANGWITGSMAREFISGKTGESTMESGRTTTWKDMEYITGLMGADMKANIIMIKNADMECICGLTAGYMKDSGSKGSNMD